MKLLNQLLRGIVIGIANIIPGVSGGTMMVSMGIYDTLIYFITHLFSEFKRSILTLLPYLIGMLIGIFAGKQLVKYRIRCRDVLQGQGSYDRSLRDLCRMIQDTAASR